MSHSDIAIIGAGIMGLAHAYHAARQGMTVTVFERDPFANGATVKNFGMLAVMAQAEGKQMDSARRNLVCWQEVAAQAKIKLDNSGCLILAKHQEEMAVLKQYTSLRRTGETSEKLLTLEELSNYAATVQQENVIGGLWSANAWKIDQRSAPAQLAIWLTKKYRVEFHYDTKVSNINLPELETNKGIFRCSRAIICGGSDFTTLYPEVFRNAAVNLCTLQMMRTVPQPNSWTLSPFVLGGLSLSRYSAFADCSGIDELKRFQHVHYRVELSHGIHTIASHEADGSVTMGDSHKYGEAALEERNDEIDQLILDETNSLISLPSKQIAERWTGVYAHSADSQVLNLSPCPNVMIVSDTAGQGMTHAFATAEDSIKEII